ncbi:AAA family ATPase [Christensenellaceae bacterium OttesenSCG-928-M15]|nr:AAA family ATPase [Christensenellaceae bacterium OttesenSCG-928-M15]
MEAALQTSLLNEQYWRDRVNSHLKETGMSQMAFAQALGQRNSSGLNQFLKGTYKSPERFIEKLQEYFNIHEAASGLHESPDYVPTSISEAVYKTIHNAHLKGGLAIECGDAGIGKTKAVQKYAADYPNNAVVVTVNPVFSSVSSFLKLICRTLNVSIGRKDDMWFNIASYFSGSRKVLIIDEAQHLPAKTIDMIRSISDDAQTLGIVFVGNQLVVSNMGGRQQAAFAQVTSRTKHSRMRFTKQIVVEDIERLFPDLPGERERAFLLAVAQSRQGIRGASNLYSNACDNEDISYEGLIQMAKFMEMGV